MIVHTSLIATTRVDALPCCPPSAAASTPLLMSRHIACGRRSMEGCTLAVPVAFQ
jgi:hypothetical protein